ncbi:MAG: PD-(D/E)XK nuclease-like domain-containing protein, partial [Leptospiraceae bacterium]|nr:PD-(D/E)XK nuclease-like domain-containing protein [Leptospiraceae bacterium]
AEAVYKNESSGWLINQFGVTEVKVEWEYYGYKWRGYIDGEGDHLLGDLKIVADAHPRKLRYKMFDMGYDRQAAMYTLLGGRKGKQYYLCAVDRGGNVSVHEITEGVMAVAMADIEYMMGQFQRCILRDLWHMSYDFHAPHGIYKISGR